MANLKDVFAKRKTYKRQFKALRNKLNRNIKIDVPDNLYVKCEKCQNSLLQEDIIENNFKCNNCNHHLKISAYNRIKLIVDDRSFIEKGIGFKTINPLNHEGYLEKIKKLKKSTSLEEAFVYGHATIEKQEFIIGVLDSFFLMGSMGSVVGEKITKSIELATQKRLPLVLFSASGGARMQEGLFSLMQMAKTSQALAKHADKKLLFTSVLTHPTYGGVTASFAMLGDIIIAEPGAMIGFAGPRVIKDTIQKELPDGFQTSEFLLEKGFIDKVVDRVDLRPTLCKILKMHKRLS